jgi:heme exporter protein C
MTSTLVLFFIYLGLVALWRAFDDQLRAGRIVAVFTLIGAINIPIVKFSVDWWHTLHQPASVLTAEGPHMPMSILTPLLVMTLAFTLLFITLQLLSMQAEVRRRRLATLERRRAYAMGSPS